MCTQKRPQSKEYMSFHMSNVKCCLRALCTATEVLAAQRQWRTHVAGEVWSCNRLAVLLFLSRLLSVTTCHHVLVPTRFSLSPFGILLHFTNSSNRLPFCCPFVCPPTSTLSVHLFIQPAFCILLQLVGIRHLFSLPLSVMYPQMPPADVATVQADVAQVDEPSTDAIECLPDLPMLTIFSYIPVVDLLATIPQVSPKLTDLRAEACRQRTSLTLLLGDYAELLLEDVLKFPNLPPVDALSKLFFFEKHLVPVATRKLTRSLPNITSLTVVLHRAEETDELWEIILLLGAWFDTLTHLVLVFGSSESKLFSLQPFINRLSNLTHLTIFDAGFFSSSSNHFHFPVMAQLESFNCSFYKGFKLFAPSIVRYFADNAQARSIDFDSFCEEDIEVILTLPPNVSRLFKRLPGSVRWKAHHLSRLTQTFQCLTSLHVWIPVVSLPSLPHSLPTVAASLASLTCLTELNLVIYGYRRSCVRDRFAIARECVPLPADTFITALPTVTCLSVTIFMPLTSHQDLVPLQLEKMVPNLKRFTIKGPFECRVCDLSDLKHRMDEEEIRQRVGCAEQLLAPIRPLFDRLELAQVGIDLDFVNNYTFVTLS